MNRFFTYTLLAGIISLSACKKDNVQNGDGTTPPVAANKIAPDGFTFATSKNVNLSIALKTNNDEPISGVVVSVMLPGSTDAIYRGVTNKSGVLQAAVTVPASATKLVIDPAYVGLMRNAQANISSSNTITAVIGGKDGFSGDIVAEDVTATPTTVTSSVKYQSNALFSTEYAYPSGYDAYTAYVNTTTYPKSLGRPAYLEATPDVIDASLLNYINASLPEGTPLSTTHPEYLKSTTTPDLNITAKSDVWITYVSEGAGNRNTLAFYTYRTGNPPTRSSGGTFVNGIDKITYIFPNASGYGSGGGLKSGDKVKIGTFDAGTSIGFVLIANGWSGSGVTTGNTNFNSQPNLNPESTSANRKHTVLLYDDVHSVYLMGFEDLNRDGSSDNDFNDLVVYASANPITAISRDGVSTVDKGGDTDGDGVQDTQDAFPNDATRAYISYYPSATGYASIAFEDNWPKKGDYDMNDLVVNCRYTFTKNASNQVVDMKGEFVPLASGASFNNGFGVQLPVSASTVKSVTGQQTVKNLISFSGNGVEANQSKAVIIPFDSQDAVLRNQDGSFFINTRTDKPKVTGTTVTVNISFVSPVAESSMQASAINPFLISNQRRAYEVHLPGYAPTDLAGSKLFGTDDDASSPTTKYYVSKENWPWAISFTSQFSYPVEEQSIDKAYPHFLDWANSGGVNFNDWYSNTATGYRDASKIYAK